jgi:hypothetical protein
MRNLRWPALALAVAAGGPALAAVGSGYTLFGDASYISPGYNSNRAVELVADTAGGEPFSGIEFGVPEGLTVGDIDTLSTAYFFPAGSSCKDGSPRFQIQVDDDSDPDTASKNIHVYIGPPPNYTGCPSDVWSDSGNLVQDSDTVDTSQLSGGQFYQTWESVVDDFGELTVTGISLVADEFSGPQTVLIDDTLINDVLYDYEPNSKQDCKKGGFKDFTTDPGPFKNQGQCVSYFAKQQKDDKKDKKDNK